jgi:hypothetical protein
MTNTSGAPLGWAAGLALIVSGFVALRLVRRHGSS